MEQIPKYENLVREDGRDFVVMSLGGRVYKIPAECFQICCLGCRAQLSYRNGQDMLNDGAHWTRLEIDGASARRYFTGCGEPSEYLAALIAEHVGALRAEQAPPATAEGAA